ncbi:hypothetical protein [Lacunimicrobium album]
MPTISLLLISLVIGFSQVPKSRALSVDERRQFEESAQRYLTNRNALTDFGFKCRFALAAGPTSNTLLQAAPESISWDKELRIVCVQGQQLAESVDLRAPHVRGYMLQNHDYELDYDTKSNIASLSKNSLGKSRSTVILDAFVGNKVLRELFPDVVAGKLSVEFVEEDEHGPIYLVDGTILLQFDSLHGCLPRFMKTLGDPLNPSRDFDEVVIQDAIEVGRGIWFPSRVQMIGRDLNHSDPSWVNVFEVSEVKIGEAVEQKELSLVVPAGAKVLMDFGPQTLVNNMTVSSHRLSSVPSQVVLDQMPSYFRHPWDAMKMVMYYPSTLNVFAPFAVSTVLIVVISVSIFRMRRKSLSHSQSRPVETKV